MSLTAVIPTKLIMNIPGVKVVSYIPLADPRELVQSLAHDDKDYFKYLVEPQLAVTVPGELRRDFEFSADCQSMIFTYLSSSRFSRYLRDLCNANGVEFVEN